MKLKESVINYYHVCSFLHFRNRLFVLYCCGMCLGNTGVVNACVFLPPRAVDLGVDKQTAAMLLSIVGACDFIGRVSGGWFADLG